MALIAGSLMVSRFRYLSGKDLDPRMRIPVAFTVLVPLGFVLVGSSPPEMLFALFAVYASSGPLWWAWRRLRRGRRDAPGDREAERMVDARQVAYLQALGVDVYVPRSAPPWQDAVAAETAAPAPRTRAAQSVARADAAAHPATAADLDWDELRAAVAACQRCDLHATRTQTVFGVGNRQARWMFIGEAPGAEEDRQGEPFVGRAGQLLTSMMRALGLRREDVFIANMLKCRPPDNRDPKPSEAASCRGYLERQIALVNPTLMIAVGRIAAQNLLATETPIAKLRGKVHSFGAQAGPWSSRITRPTCCAVPAKSARPGRTSCMRRQLFGRLEQESASGGRA